MAECADPAHSAHSVFFYRGERQYLDTLLPFIFDGLSADQPVLVAVPTARLQLLRGACDDALGGEPAGLAFADMSVVGRNPAHMLAMEFGFVAEHPGRPVRMIDEVMWPERTVDEREACIRHEALVNQAFAEHDTMGLCPYDVGALDEETLADAKLTHPGLWRNGVADANPDYSPEAAEARYNRPLPSDPDAVTYLVQEYTDLSAARSVATRFAQQEGLSRNKIADLQLIATELATNSLRHTGGACRLALWRHDGHVVCQAGDDGRFEDPLAGSQLPSPDSPGGRGLFLVNAIADLVRAYATPTDTTIQAYLRLQPEAQP